MINELREYTGTRAPRIAQAMQAERIQDAIERRAETAGRQAGRAERIKK